MKFYFFLIHNLIVTLAVIASVTYLVHDGHAIMATIIAAGWILLIAMLTNASEEVR